MSRTDEEVSPIGRFTVGDPIILPATYLRNKDKIRMRPNKNKKKIEYKKKTDNNSG